MKGQISIIGCGWLGLPLAQSLIEKNYKIKGSTTSESKLSELHKSSIEGFVITLNEEGIKGNIHGFLNESDTIIINIPPGLRRHPNKNHVKEIEHLMDAITRHKIKNILYVSSTSVFENEEHFPVIKNNTKPNATSNSALQLIVIEKMLKANGNFNTTILRFGGLLDDFRHPGKFLSGRKNISDPDAPINLIHKEDCIGIISTILQQNYWNIALNASYPIHPNKSDYYISYSKRHGLDLPEFNLSKKNKGKIIDSSELVQLLKYRFKQAP
ncbi:MAG: NAD(P)H-binding protein [Winogradskyella sp.]|uniref:NAD(P)H-binding protein n=1 Tax=Winogradskyella sp. TaxID=1883156 RepID=UPI0025FE3F2A|nr:NAD(P)H-binding protein [Winogradskyella sp.]NRB59441.1 NAD(P)H-binding protein [Winogradskyella sp.]